MPRFESISPFEGFHATEATFDRFGDTPSRDPFHHIGTMTQATARGGPRSTILRVSVYATSLIRKRDTGSWMARDVTARNRDEADGIVYLNRHEGVEVRDAGVAARLDGASDFVFRTSVPSVRDSYGIFSPDNLRIVERIPWMSVRHRQLLDYERGNGITDPEDLPLRPIGLPLPVTDEAIERARAFVLEKWRERWHENHPRGPTWTAICGWDYPPEDLSGSCKFSSIFASHVFGGRLSGHEDHQFVTLLDGTILDLNYDAGDVVAMDDPHRHDASFFGNPGHMDSMRSCLPRVMQWIGEFARDERLRARCAAKPGSLTIGR